MSRIPHFVVVALISMCATVTGCTSGSEKAASAPAAQAANKAPVVSDALPAEQTGGFDGAKAFAHVEKLVAIGPRQSGTPGIRLAQDYIRTQLQSFGCTVDEDSFDASTPSGRIPMRNILVKIPGASTNIVLLLTHYDTKRQENFVGANDGGSSTGLMLEMARQLCGKKGDVSVWIAFLDGEEALVEWSDTDGTYGSRQMAAKLAVASELKRVKAVVLADMIGDRDLTVKRESNSTRWLTDVIWNTARRLGYEKYFLSETQSIEDDHIPFLRRGVPAVDLIDLDYPAWHTPNDTLDKVSARSIGVVGHVILESVEEIEKKVR
ncbi:MAG: M28 family peptidase [Acidobacteria bacterium]|nr:M28 family peptidase [Acidobacteriota bacterium]MCL5288258.1 M28 family peptidase [Acidobacteriota bacterium]